MVGALLMTADDDDGRPPGDAGRRLQVLRATAASSTLNLLTSIGAIVFIVGFVITMLNAAASYSKGVEVGPDPWHGSTLEWFTPSPPPVHNFDLIPDVRSAEPLDDMRDAIRRRATRWYPPAVTAAQPERDAGSPGPSRRRRRSPTRRRPGSAGRSATTQDEDDSPVA